MDTHSFVDKYQDQIYSCFRAGASEALGVGNLCGPTKKGTVIRAADPTIHA